jgi:hypothetical protein
MTVMEKWHQKSTLKTILDKHMENGHKTMVNPKKFAVQGWLVS